MEILAGRVHRDARRGGAGVPAEDEPLAAAASGPTQRRFDLALTEARRGFDEQASQFTKMRTTVGGLLGYGGVASSVLVVAPGAAPGPNARLLLYVAASTFSLLAIIAVYVLLPVKVIPGADVQKLVGWADAGDDPDAMSRDLALHYETAYQTNKKALDRRTAATTLALATFAATVIVLVIRLTGA